MILHNFSRLRHTMSDQASSSQAQAPSSSNADARQLDPKETYIREITEYVKRSPAVLFGDKSFDDDHVLCSFEHITLGASTNETLGTIVGSSSYTCSVCLGIPREPCSLLKCGHIGCEKCFMQYLVTGNSHNIFTPRDEIGSKPCPLCRLVYNAKDVTRFAAWPNFAKNVWGKMCMSCENCEFTDSPMSVVDHERTSCIMRRVQCPGCPAIATVNEMIDHALQCKHVLVYCVRCGYPIRYQLRDLHDCGKFIYALRRRPDIAAKSGRRGAVVTDTIIPSEDWQALWSGDALDANSISPTTPIDGAVFNANSPTGNITLSELSAHERLRRAATTARPAAMQTPPRIEEVPSSQPRDFDVPPSARRTRRSVYRSIFES
jgi:hypothetical protein